MKIVLCSTKDSIRERWRTILLGHQFSIYQASSMQMLQSIVHKNEKYLLLIHQTFTDLRTIGTLSRAPEVFKIFVLSDSPGKEEGIAFLQRGIVGYANTYISEGRLVEAVKNIQSGRVWYSQEIMATFIQAVAAGQESLAREKTGKALEVLSKREKEIALLVSEGLSNQEIGEKLYISERTVKSHLGTIFDKTGAGSRLKLALLVRSS